MGHMNDEVIIGNSYADTYMLLGIIWIGFLRIRTETQVWNFNTPWMQGLSGCLLEGLNME